MRTRSRLGRAGGSAGLFAMVVGPGIITANVDNDAGGIATYSRGRREVRLRACSGSCPHVPAPGRWSRRCAPAWAWSPGKGLSGLIRERFGLKASFYLMLALVVTNIGNAIADFAGVAAGAEIFGISAVPRGPRRRVPPLAPGRQGDLPVRRAGLLRRLPLLRDLHRLGLPRAARLGRGARASVVPHDRLERRRTSYMIVGIVGHHDRPLDAVLPAGERGREGHPAEALHATRGSTRSSGALVVTVVCYFIVLACAATLHAGRGRRSTTAADAARALEPIAGHGTARTLFALGLLSASYFGATILPISTATSVCEAMGWESGVDRKFTEAPQYYSDLHRGHPDRRGGVAGRPPRAR